MVVAVSAVAPVSWIGGSLFLIGAVLFPGWLLVTGRRLRYRGRRVRGAYWGGVVGHLLGDALFLAVLLTPPLMLPGSDGSLMPPLLLVVPAVLGAMVGAVVGRRRVSRRA